MKMVNYHSTQWRLFLGHGAALGASAQEAGIRILSAILSQERTRDEGGISYAEVTFGHGGRNFICATMPSLFPTT